MDASVLPWIGHVLLAFAFLTVGDAHSAGLEQAAVRAAMGG